MLVIRASGAEDHGNFLARHPGGNDGIPARHETGRSVQRGEAAAVRVEELLGYHELFLGCGRSKITEMPTISIRSLVGVCGSVFGPISGAGRHSENGQKNLETMLPRLSIHHGVYSSDYHEWTF